MTSSSLLLRQSFCSGASDVVRGLMVVGGLRKTGLRTSAPHMGQSTVELSVCVTCNQELAAPGRRGCSGKTLNFYVNAAVPQMPILHVDDLQRCTKKIFVPTASCLPQHCYDHAEPFRSYSSPGPASRSIVRAS